MGTRTRAATTAILTTLVVFIGLVDLIDYEGLLMRWGVGSHLLAQFISAAVISVILIMGTWWTLYFKRKGASLIVIGTFPGLAIYPFLLVIESLTSSIFSGFGQLTVAVISAGMFGVVSYLLILTVNILNGAVLFGIPLGQAGKAAQFIFSLISSYFLIALMFGASFPIELRVIIIGMFSFYFAYSTTWTLQVPAKQSWLTAISIASVLMLTTVLLSIWPISSIYATLAMVVILYILLNIALEMRERIANVIWVEYILLIGLIIVILFTNSNWGISGPIL
jgi:hypothetical protein